MYETLAVLGLFVFSYSLAAGRIEKTWISGPIIFCLFGFLVGTHGFNLLPLAADSEQIKTLAELTLAMVLFTDAASANIKVLRRNANIPVRLLLIGLPLTLGLGYLIGWALFGQMSALEIALLATMLAPTDAALGMPVITNQAVPGEYREGLNVESGLNDGICVPILMIFLELATGDSGRATGAGMIFSRFAAEIGIGATVGLGLTFVAVLTGRFAAKMGWIDHVWSMLSVPGLALGCFGLAQHLGGSGFIAAFTGGLLFDVLLGKQREPWLEEAESLGKLFSLITWIIFGASVINPGAGSFGWSIVLYGVLSLSLIRMLPVFVSLAGLGLPVEARFFLGWFGPRGLASVVFCVIVMNADLPHKTILTQVVAVTVILSILLHGMTANLWAAGFGHRMRQSR